MPSKKAQQIIDHAESRISSGQFSTRDINLIKSAAYLNDLDRVLAPQAIDSSWLDAYREALPIVEKKWQCQTAAQQVT